MGVQAISGGLGLAGGLYQAIQGNKEGEDAKSALANYHRQQLHNVTEGMTPSTYGSNLARQEQGRLASEQVNALQGSGVRGVVGGIGRVQAGNEDVMGRNGANLDLQQHQIENMRAEDDARIRAMKNDIENRDIAGLSSQVQSGKQDMYGGFGNIIKSADSFGKPSPTERPMAESLSGQIQPQGFSSNNNNLPFSSYLNTNKSNYIYPISQFGQLGNGMYANPNPYVTQNP